MSRTYTRIIKQACLLLMMLVHYNFIIAQTKTPVNEAEATMLKATHFMQEQVSTNGGFVWYYLPDLSRRWGEMEAYPTQIWVQDGGTVSVGHMLLDAYHATHNEYFYSCAQMAANAIIWGQSHEGGWNYLIDFAGDRSLKKWYNTIGKNGWRLEEFQHYYGNDTYDDDVTSDAARLLLRMYLEKLDPVYKPALDKAIDFMLRSQYPNGGWPQRYPLKYDFKKSGHPDYTSFFTFNDDVIWENVNFLVQCYQTLGEERFLDPIYRGMNFYYISQQENGAWGQQYDTCIQVAGARTYEPTALLPRTTFINCMMLMRFYSYTGDRKFLSGVPKAIEWLEAVKYTDTITEHERYTHPLFIDPVTNKAIYQHRKGSNVAYGYYYIDSVDTPLVGHMRAKTSIDINRLKEEYASISKLSVTDATKDSPILPARFSEKGTPQTALPLSRANMFFRRPDSENIQKIITALDEQGRWLVPHVMISHPYIGDGKNKAATDIYASTFVGDDTDTSPYRDTTEQLYISTPAYIRNMEMLIRYIEENKKDNSKH